MTIGILGFGTMGSAFASGLGAAGVDCSLIAYDKSEGRRDEAARGGLAVAASAEELVQRAELLVVAVKPQDLAALLAGLGTKVKGRRIVSVVAGKSIAVFEKACGTREIARLMPNIAATVRESFVGVAFHPDSSESLRSSALSMARAIGTAVEVPERLLPAVTGVAGSGIAFALAFLHAMALGGVHAGLDYRSSLGAAVQTVRGAAALLAHEEAKGGMGGPVELLSKVTSPAGTTIEGIKVLEEGAFTAAVMGAVKAAADRAAELERQAG